MSSADFEASGAKVTPGREKSPFYERRENAQAFILALQEMFAHENSPEISNRIDSVLDVIGKRGISQVARLVWETVESPSGEFIPADASDVRSYLANVYGVPRISVKDIGSVDNELIASLQLDKDDYTEKIDELLTYAAIDRDTLSVLELPEIQQKMFMTEITALRKILSQSVVEIHGVSYVFGGRNDESKWQKVQGLAEQLSLEVFRKYSHYLRNRRREGKERLPLDDAYSDMDEMLRLRDRAIERARIGAESTPAERRRLTETTNPRIAEQLQEWWDRIDDLRREDRES